MRPLVGLGGRPLRPPPLAEAPEGIHVWADGKARLPRRLKFDAEGIEVCGVRGGVAPPHWGRVWGGGYAPPRKFFEVFVWNGVLWCILSGIFVKRCLQDTATIHHVCWPSRYAETEMS